jgi:hypothetical protein
MDANPVLGQQRAEVEVRLAALAADFPKWEILKDIVD